jgi:hypothetical protein
MTKTPKNSEHKQYSEGERLQMAYLVATCGGPARESDETVEAYRVRRSSQNKALKILRRGRSITEHEGPSRSQKRAFAKKRRHVLKQLRRFSHVGR